MPTVGAYEAKTHFSQILKKVGEGERFTIEKHGVPVATLEPVSPKKKMSFKEAIAEMKKFRAGRTLDDITIRELIEEGRR